MREYKIFREKYPDDDIDIDAFFQMKGWRNDIFLFIDNKFYKFIFYTPEVLPGFINSHIKHFGMALLNPYVIIIPDIEMHCIVKAISNIIANNWLDSYAPLQEVAGLVEIKIERE
jgi:hypothetical protein